MQRSLHKQVIKKVDILEHLHDFGFKPLEGSQKLMLLELFEDRQGRKSTIIASQLVVNQWHAFIKEDTLADAILDRVVHGSHRIELKRKYQ